MMWLLWPFIGDMGANIGYHREYEYWWIWKVFMNMNMNMTLWVAGKWIWIWTDEHENGAPTFNEYAFAKKVNMSIAMNIVMSMVFISGMVNFHRRYS